MKSQGLLYFSDIHLIVLGLVIFFVSFLIMVGLQWYRLDKKLLSHVSYMPLQDDKVQQGEQV